MSLISLLAWAKPFHNWFWNKWCFLCWFFPVWIQGLSEQWLETSFSLVLLNGMSLVLGQFGECGDWEVWAKQETQGLLGLHLRLHLKSRRPRGAFPQENSLLTSPEHLIPLEKHPQQNWYHYSLNRLTKPKPHMFEPLCCTFKWFCWTK